jgi:two-component system sensor histidine kinase QseC
MIWLVVNRTLSPLNQLKRQLARREFGNLQALPAKRLPDELLPVVNQINSLFQQLEQAINNERNFTSDASHELKTPLAGLLTQMQVAQKTDDPAVRSLALQKAQQAVMRMTHMVQQLLTLSRVQHDSASINKQALNVNEALIAVIADMDAVAHAKSIDVELEVPANLAMNANPQLLQILVRNLVDNAIKYSPNGRRVLIKAQQIEQHIDISVEDSGNGVADNDYQRLTQRFYRCVETAALVEGSGLGLSIAQRIISLHHAEIQFSKSELGGLKALLRFPLNNNPINNADLHANMM